jgi:hypothetical protein
MAEFKAYFHLFQDQTMQKNPLAVKTFVSADHFFLSGRQCHTQSFSVICMLHMLERQCCWAFLCPKPQNKRDVKGTESKNNVYFVFKTDSQRLDG